MSLNRILNRPMFRREALRKGHLKPIKARVGRSIIGPMQPPVPAIYQGTPLGVPVGATYNTGMTNVKQPTRFQNFLGGAKNLGRNILSIPGIGGYVAGEKVAEGLGITDPIGKGAFGFGGGALATRALPGLASIGVLPSAVGLGTIYAIQNRVKAGIEERKRIKAMSPKEREEFFRQNRAKAFDYMSEGLTDEELFGKIDPSKLDEIVKKPRTTIPNPGAGRPSSKYFKQKQEDVATAPDNVTKFGKTKVIDTAKIAENTIPNIDSGRGGDSASAEARQTAMPGGEGEDPKEDPKGDPPKGKGDPKADPDGDSIKRNSAFAAEIDMARQIVKEMRQGKTSQANMVFLSNLASGLLTGTTRKSGLGGALEVFGAALGPAVNNMVMVKMKEDEIEQNLMGDALELAFAENKRRNTAAELPDVDKHGVIQIKDQNGNPQNVIGVRYANGTHGIASGKFDQFNREIFIPITSQEFTKFIDGEKGEAERFKILRDLSGKYKAYQIGETSIALLRKEDVTGGPKGKLDLFVKRTSDALNDLGITFIGRDGIEAGKRKISELRQDLINEYAFDNDVSVKEAEKIIDKTFKKQFSIKGRDSLLDSTLKRFGVEFRGTGADLEQLAINETILTYALANSLKSKDRLTQKDIEMAAKLVNVFPIGRGEASVIESLEAVNRTLLKDIEASEFDYQFAFGGDTATINEYRKKYGTLKPTQEQFKLPGFADESSEDLIKKFYK